MIHAILQNEINKENEGLVRFAEAIDFEPLFDRIRLGAGVQCEFDQPEIKIWHGQDVYIDFKSENIVEKISGPFGKILSECYLESCSNCVVLDERTNTNRYWASVHVSYEHKDGGSNGMELLRAEYRDGEWIFVHAGDRA
jgi:hypothetical protein